MLESISKTRLETLSDGIFAIILTLLVLEIRVPHIGSPHSLSELSHALLHLVPKFIGWVISFFTVCVIWLNHHRLFETLATSDRGVFWWNAQCLLWTSFIPFPTALIGDYPMNKLAVSFYGIVMFLMGISFVLFRRYLYKNPHLFHRHVNQEHFRKGIIYTILFGPLAYFIGASLAWVSPIASFICYALITMYFVFPRTLNSVKNETI